MEKNHREYAKKKLLYKISSRKLDSPNKTQIKSNKPQNKMTKTYLRIIQMDSDHIEMLFLKDKTLTTKTKNKRR